LHTLITCAIVIEIFLLPHHTGSFHRLKNPVEKAIIRSEWRRRIVKPTFPQGMQLLWGVEKICP
jgi:hypothetical protein